ncbi:MAG: virulence protein RhuM/Fic/DOC family protein [Burkholderiaceae bacterium]
MSGIALYTASSGVVEVRVEGRDVWLRQEQIAALFGRDRTVIGRHIRNVFTDGELEAASVCANFAQTAADGKTYQVEHHNLDLIISVGYRVKSPEGVRFRQWATRLLREHLTRGYTLNRQRLEANAQELEAALRLIRHAARLPVLSTEEGRGLVDVVSRYAQTFALLQRYDEGLLTEPPTRAGGTLPTAHEARAALANLKSSLMARGEASELFARERADALSALLGNLEQTAFGEPVYPSIEAKAAHLLYFVIKNHPFADGNKRSAAFLFVDFLNRNQRLLDTRGEPVLNDMGLAALCLLVAESAPAQKDTLIRLVMNMLVDGEGTE